MKISELPVAEKVNNEDVFPVVQAGETKKAPKEALQIPDDVNITADGNVVLLVNGEKIGEGVPLPKIEVDTEMSDTSENPVENKVAKAYTDKTIDEAIKQTQNIYANALKGKETGEIISASDVSPIEHDINLKVESKNLIPFKNKSYKNGQYVAGQTYEINGVSFTVNNDGSVYAVGTATGSYSIFYLYTAPTIEKGNDVVTLSGSPEGSSATTYFLRLRNDNAVTGIYEDYGSGVTIKNANVSKSSIAIIVLQGQSIDATCFPKLEYGTKPTEYEPYIDPTSVMVTGCGKNLWSSGDVQTTVSSYAAITLDMELQAGTAYTLTADVTSTDTDDNMCAIYDANNLSKPLCLITRGVEQSVTFIPPKNCKTLFMFASVTGNASRGDTATYSRIQLELGDTATEYEPFKGVSYTSNADGTVTGIRSVNPNMTFAADTKGVNLTCEYNKDINKVIEDLVNAIISLGGNV